MRLNRDVDDFKLDTGEEGDIILRCGKDGCESVYSWWFGAPTIGEAIAVAYKHLDEAHPEAER
jgi:hypothetical protein